MIHKDQRTEYDTKILNWRHVRNNERTAAMLEQMQQKKAIRTIYGIYEKPSLFVDVADPFTQSLPCVGHCIDLGILLRLIDGMISQVRSSTRKSHIFLGRLFSMELPRQWTRVKINLLSVHGKRQKSMHFVRKVGLMSTLLSDGLVNQ